MTEPSDYPAFRAWAFPEAIDLQQFPALATARAWSCAVLSRLRAALADLGRHAPETAMVAVSGSLGRLEAGTHSDADVIVVLHQAVSGRRAAQLMSHVWDALALVGPPRPTPTGIYATPATFAELCSRDTVGRIDEDVPTFGKRIQLILDAQPVYGFDGSAGAFATVQAGILRRYHSQSWAYLLNDLIRYFRSVRVRDQWNFSTGKGGWYLRSLKQEHSRVVLYAGLLLLLGEGGKESHDPPGWLAARLPWTPLERIAAVYVANADPHFNRVASAYERFLEMTAHAEHRALLSAAAPAAVADLQRGAPAVYEALLANARLLQRELVRFVLARQADWGERFLEMLLF